MKTFAIADERAEKFARWKAPEPEFGTVHEMRKLRMCEVCNDMGNNLIEIAPPPKRGKAGRYLHGYCYAKRYGRQALWALPYEGALDKVSLNEFIALGYREDGWRRFRRLCKLAAKRGQAGLVLTETHARRSYCTELVTRPESVLGQPCYRKATTKSDKGKPVCAWHRHGRIFRDRGPQA